MAHHYLILIFMRMKKRIEFLIFELKIGESVNCDFFEVVISKLFFPKFLGIDWRKGNGYSSTYRVFRLTSKINFRAKNAVLVVLAPIPKWLLICSEVQTENITSIWCSELFISFPLHFCVMATIGAVYSFFNRYRPRFFDQVGHQTTYTYKGNKAHLTKIMTSSDLPKLWTEQTKIGHIFRKRSTLKIKNFKNFIYKSWSPSQIYFIEKKFRKIRLIFDAEKWLWKYKFCKLWGGCS